MASSTSPTANIWERYSRTSEAEARQRGADSRLYWDWYQRLGPGAEILGDVTGRTVADLGAGAGRQAAHIADVLDAARVIAIDTSAAQVSRGRAVFGHVHALKFVHGDAVTHVTAAAGALDVAYSLFGAVDFTDPHALLPAIASGLRPGGVFVMATLAHYKGGQPAETDVRPAGIPVRRDDGTQTSMQRWVLDTPVWEKLLTEAGFADITTEVLQDPGTEKQAPMATTLIRAVCA